MKKLKLTVLTPDKILISDKEVNSIVIPAFEGEMGILPGHIPYMAELKEGILKYKAEGNEDFMSVFWGFVMVYKDKVTILTELGEMIDDLNEERARQEYQKAENAIRMKGADIDLDSAYASLKKSVVRLKLAEIKKRRK